MDLLAFEPGDMYFDEPLDPRAEALIQEASETYGEPQALVKLREAESIAPEHLSVLVAIYRYHFYRHEHAAALAISARAMDQVARRLNWPQDWRDVSAEDVARALANSAELARFYLYALKGAGYLLLRLDRPGEGLERLDKITTLDPKDRLGAAALAEVARDVLATSAA